MLWLSKLALYQVNYGTANMGTANRSLPSETTILHEKRQAMGITPIEYMIIDALYKNPKLRRADIALFVGLSERHIVRLVNGLVEKGLLLKDGRGVINVSDRWHNEIVMQDDNMSPNMTNCHDKISPSTKEKERSKEKEYINIHSQNTSYSSSGRSAKKPPSCPLLTGSKFTEQYPGGHTECGDYLSSEEEDRGRKFINRPKQFQAIHKILRAGYNFTVMDRVIPQVEAKYGKGAWDFSTLANWIEKGAS